MVEAFQGEARLALSCRFAYLLVNALHRHLECRMAAARRQVRGSKYNLGETMTQVTQQDFTANLLKLLKETFEEGGSFYLDKGAGLFQTLEAITPEAASRAPVPGAPTVAAHCAHVSYYVRVVHNFIVGKEQEVDWPSSWQVHDVGPREWEALKGELRSAYETLKQALESVQSWGDARLGDSMAVVAHTAYHLGAIRQVVRAVQS